MLVGNKKDLEADRDVPFMEAARFAQENGGWWGQRMERSVLSRSKRPTHSTELMFLETSARTGENVEEVFLKCARTILAKIESGECG